MGTFFEPFSADRCCLCGSDGDLTGEHKIKASLLRSLFGRDAMVIGHFDGVTSPRAAQGPKSRQFHFSARVCGRCNSAQTQSADNEFVRFNESARALASEGKEPSRVFDMERYRHGSEPYLNVFRYLAKVLACQIAESSGPRSLPITEFAIGASNANPIKLSMDFDPFFHKYTALSGEDAFAAHGGLAVRASTDTGLLCAFETSLSFGALRYTFWVEFSSLVATALQSLDGDFYHKCCAAYRAALENQGD